jgi:hypothetical protein
MLAELTLFDGDHVLHGVISWPQGRLLDHLNDPGASTVDLQHVSVAPRARTGSPVLLAEVSLPKASVMLVVPKDAPLRVPPAMRRGWKEKRPVRAVLGVGPFLVHAQVHLDVWEFASRQRIEQEFQSTSFIPLTDVYVDGPGLSEAGLGASVAFVAAAAVGFVAVPEGKTAVAVPDQEALAGSWSVPLAGAAQLGEN